MYAKRYIAGSLLFLSIFIGLSGSSAQADEFDVMASAKLKEIWFDEDQFIESASDEAELSNQAFTRGSDLENLLHAKFKMINGDLRFAKFYLNRIDDRKSRVFPIKKRYLAIIAFIEDHFQESINYLSDKRFYENSIYRQVCLLKLINFMAINDTESLKKDKESCSFITMNMSQNDQYWLDTMVKLKMKDSAGVKKNLLTNVQKTIADDEMAKLWLKTGLYLNKEEDLLKLISLLPESSYQSKRLREIIAFMYLRSNTAEDKQKALAFVDDIDSANAENIKGNINLQNKEYELAFGHFRLALQKKQDSSNSLERAIPLAWMLNQWTDGLVMLESNFNKSLDPRNVRALRTAFLIREKKFTEAKKELTLLRSDFKNQPPYEVDVMDSYVSLMTADKEKKFDKRKIEDITEKACRSYDGINCWISLQFIEWENLGKTIMRDDEIFADKAMTIDSLKEKKEITPLKEAVLVDQKDIEELDSAGIELMKKTSK